MIYTSILIFHSLLNSISFFLFRQNSFFEASFLSTGKRGNGGQESAGSRGPVTLHFFRSQPTPREVIGAEATGGAGPTPQMGLSRLSALPRSEGEA